MNAYEYVDNLRARGFSLTADDSQIFVSPGSCLTDSDRILIREHKPAILRDLADDLHIDRLAIADGWNQSTVQPVPVEDESPSTFLETYASEHADRIHLARSLVLDLETTGLSPFGEEVKTVDHVGHRRFRRSRPLETGGFFSQVPTDCGSYYVDEFSGCQIDTTRRIRVISVLLMETGWIAAWDLDRLSPEDRRRLAYDVLEGKIVIGHNVSFDFNWLTWLTDAIPTGILDSMLIAKWHAHHARLEVHKRAAAGDEECKAFVKKAGGAGAGFSLDQCAAAFGFVIPDKVYQKACNWCVTDLSADHYEYCVGDVTLPLEIIRAALELEAAADLDMILGALDGGGYVTDCEPALQSLTRAHRLGMPISIEAIDTLNTQMDVEMAKQTDLTIAIAPKVLEPIRKDLQRGSITTTLRKVLGDYLQTRGKHLPPTKNGNSSLSSKALTKARLLDEPLINRWVKINQAASTKKSLMQWRDHIAASKRAHPMISISTVPGRMSSEHPNSQGLPKNPAFRAIIKAEPGHLIIAADYSQIELRVAAAMVKRELAVVEEYLDGRRKLNLKSWIRLALEDARNRHVRGGRPPALYTDGSWRDVQAAELGYSYYQVLRSGPMMATILREGFDIHLLTAIGMAARAGTVNLEGLSEIEFLRKTDRKRLRAQLVAERQAAKAINFGLLYGQSAAGLDGEGGLYAYGITNYDLSWSPEDAEEAHNLWFNKLYPEFRFWHVWSRLATTDPLALMLHGYNGLAIKEQARVWVVTTLGGREMVALGKCEALNYPVQGSGAELILRAMGRLPEPANRYLINVIHDEFLFEVPTAQAELVRDQVVGVMQAVGDEMLSPYDVPVEVEASMGNSWGSLK